MSDGTDVLAVRSWQGGSSTWSVALAEPVSLPGPDQVIVVHFDSHELDFDYMVSRATPVLDSIEFV